MIKSSLLSQGHGCRQSAMSRRLSQPRKCNGMSAPDRCSGFRMTVRFGLSDEGSDLVEALGKESGWSSNLGEVLKK